MVTTIRITKNELEDEIEGLLFDYNHATILSILKNFPYDVHIVGGKTIDMITIKTSKFRSFDFDLHFSENDLHPARREMVRKLNRYTVQHPREIIIMNNALNIRYNDYLNKSNRFANHLYVTSEPYDINEHRLGLTIHVKDSLELLVNNRRVNTFTIIVADMDALRPYEMVPPSEGFTMEGFCEEKNQNLINTINTYGDRLNNILPDLRNKLIQIREFYIANREMLIRPTRKYKLYNNIYILSYEQYLCNILKMLTDYINQYFRPNNPNRRPFKVQKNMDRFYFYMSILLKTPPELKYLMYYEPIKLLHEEVTPELISNFFKIGIDTMDNETLERQKAKIRDIIRYTNNLTGDEKDLMIEWASNEGYKLINGNILKNPNNLGDKVVRLKNILNRAPELNGDSIEVYRLTRYFNINYLGINKQITTLNTGDYFFSPVFMSTTINKEFLKSEAFSTALSYCCLFKIKIPKNVKSIYISHRNEFELLLPMGSVFKVTDRKLSYQIVPRPNNSRQYIPYVTYEMDYIGSENIERRTIQQNTNITRLEPETKEEYEERIVQVPEQRRRLVRRLRRVNIEEKVPVDDEDEDDEDEDDEDENEDDEESPNLLSKIINGVSTITSYFSNIIVGSSPPNIEQQDEERYVYIRRQVLEPVLEEEEYTELVPVVRRVPVQREVMVPVTRTITNRIVRFQIPTRSQDRLRNLLRRRHPINQDLNTLYVDAISTIVSKIQQQQQYPVHHQEQELQQQQQNQLLQQFDIQFKDILMQKYNELINNFNQSYYSIKEQFEEMIRESEINEIKEAVQRHYMQKDEELKNVLLQHYTEIQQELQTHLQQNYPDHYNSIYEPLTANLQQLSEQLLEELETVLTYQHDDLQNHINNLMDIYEPDDISEPDDIKEMDIDNDNNDNTNEPMEIDNTQLGGRTKRKINIDNLDEMEKEISKKPKKYRKISSKVSKVKDRKPYIHDLSNLLEKEPIIDGLFKPYDDSLQDEMDNNSMKYLDIYLEVLHDLLDSLESNKNITENLQKYLSITYIICCGVYV